MSPIPALRRNTAMLRRKDVSRDDWFIFMSIIMQRQNVASESPTRYSHWLDLADLAANVLHDALPPRCCFHRLTINQAIARTIMRIQNNIEGPTNITNDTAFISSTVAWLPTAASWRRVPCDQWPLFWPDQNRFASPNPFREMNLGPSASGKSRPNPTLTRVSFRGVYFMTSITSAPSFDRNLVSSKIRVD